MGCDVKLQRGGSLGGMQDFTAIKRKCWSVFLGCVMVFTPESVLWRGAECGHYVGKLVLVHFLTVLL